MAITVLESVQSKLREELSPTVREALPDIDPLFGEVKNTSIGVQRSDIGRGYKVIHTFVTSLAGAFYWTGAGGQDMADVYLTSTANYYPAQMLSSTYRTFPSASQAVNPGLVQRTLTLVQGSGNMAFPIQLLQTDELNASILRYVAKSIQLTARNVAHLSAMAFYADNTMGGIGIVASSSVSSNVVTLTLGTGSTAGRIGRFFPGMMVDFLYVSGSGYAKRNSYPGLVVFVDYLKRQIKVRATYASDLDSVVDTDLITPWNSVTVAAAATDTFRGPSGLRTWVVKTGSIFGIPLAVYPQMSSIVEAVSASLTDDVLNKYFGAFEDAYGSMVKLDTIITTGGVTREYLSQQQDLGVFQRQGAALNLQGGWADIGYQYNGRKYKWLISRYCPPSTLFAIKTGEGNLVRYVPPRIPGSGTNREFDGEVQFLAPLGGAAGIFLNARDGDGKVTEIVEAPFYTLYEMAPNFPQSIKLTSVTELNATIN